MSCRFSISSALLVWISAFYTVFPVSGHTFPSRRAVAKALPVLATNLTEGECASPFRKEDYDVMRSAAERLKERRQSQTEVIFNVYFNIVMSNLTYAGGWVPDSQIEDQVKVMNEGFAGTGISFNYSGTRRILEPNWHHNLAVPTNFQRAQMLYDYGDLFRNGGANTLNINTVGFSYDDRLFGFSLTPNYYAEAPQWDGVFVRFVGLPGSPVAVARMGLTAVHELGHWLGLYHTFEGGCDGIGDGVADTPAQASSTQGCPIGRDSCPLILGEDPIHNFMDYSSESCRGEWTPGQINRMHSMIRAYRSRE